MRRLLWAGIRLLPIMGCLWSLSCSVTGRQLTDAISTSLIRTVVLSISSIIEASITSTGT